MEGVLCTIFQFIFMYILFIQGYNHEHVDDKSDGVKRRGRWVDGHYTFDEDEIENSQSNNSNSQSNFKGYNNNFGYKQSATNNNSSQRPGVGKYINVQSANIGNGILVDGKEFLVTGYYRTIDKAKVFYLNRVSDGKEYILDGNFLFLKITHEQFTPTNIQYSKMDVRTTSSEGIPWLWRNDSICRFEFCDVHENNMLVTWRIEVMGTKVWYYVGGEGREVFAFTYTKPLAENRYRHSKVNPLRYIDFNENDFFRIKSKYYEIKHIDIEVDQAFDIRQTIKLENLKYYGSLFNTTYAFEEYTMQILRGSIILISEKYGSQLVNEKDIFVVKDYHWEKTQTQQFFENIAYIAPYALIYSILIPFFCWEIKSLNYGILFVWFHRVNYAVAIGFEIVVILLMPLIIEKIGPYFVSIFSDIKNRPKDSYQQYLWEKKKEKKAKNDFFIKKMHDYLFKKIYRHFPKL